MPVRRGFFLVIEGADGSGKTTLVRAVAAVYRARGWKVSVVREPGGTRFSERVRRLLLDNRSRMRPRAELFLYLAARAQVVDEVIRPALARGQMVVADRFSVSTYAYQAAGRGLPLFAVAGADQFARDGLTPDLGLVLRVSAEVAGRRLRRSARRLDRIEAQSVRFHRAVREFYETWGRRRPGYRLIDGDGDPQEVLSRAVRLIDNRLRRLSLPHALRPSR